VTGRRLVLLVVAAAGLGTLASDVHAQQVSWAASAVLGVGQVQKLELLFENCQPEGAVQLPDVDGLVVVGEPTESRSFSMVNFKTSSSVSFSYPVRATRAGELVVPAFEVETSQGRLRVAELRLRAAGARLPGAGGRGEALDDVVQAELRASPMRPYAGEVVDLELLIGVDARRQASLGGPAHWSSPGLLSEGWSEPEQIRLGARSGVRMRNRVQVSQPGPIELPPVEQELNIETGGRGPGFFFSRQMTSVVVATDPVALTVRPLPEPAAPGFAGAVGRFEIESRLVPERVHAGEPVTWTLQLSGRGNWPDGVGLPARAVPRDLRAIQPRSQRDFPGGGVFEGVVSEDVVLIPERAGEIELAPVRFVYFDPERESYEVAEVGPQRLTVLPAVAGAPAPVTPVPGAAGERSEVAREAAPDTELAVIPDAPARLPRDLLVSVPAGPFALAATRPLPRPWLLRLSLGPAGLALAVWILLAVRRARALDPVRPRRRAREGVIAAIEAVAAARDGAARRAPLLRWQQQVAILLELGHAAPAGPRVEASAAAADPTWAELWRESERAVHAAEAFLAADWPARAARAARRLTLPRGWPGQLLRRSSWLPALLLSACAASLAAACIVGAPAAAKAQRPVPPSESDRGERVDLADRAYREGRFEEAEAGYRQRITRDGADWRAHYNLALARAQQGDAGEALAQTTAAFLLQPRDPSVRWNLALFAREVGAIDPQLRELVFARGTAQLSRLLPARRWQTGLLAGAGLSWTALALALVRRYRGARGRALWPAPAIAGFLLVAVSWLALLGYGELADPNIAMLARDASLRSLPSEAEGVGIARELPRGQLLRLERELLAWVEVELASGERGWLRRSALVPIYRPALAPAVAEALERPSLPAPPPGSSEAT
jgi:tetratricopeptide (TPR) repeat protein